MSPEPTGPPSLPWDRGDFASIGLGKSRDWNGRRGGLVRHSVLHMCAHAQKRASSRVGADGQAEMCSCADTSERAQREHTWACGEGEVFQVWQPRTAARAQVPTGAGRSAHEHAPTPTSCRVSEQAVNMCVPVRGHRPPATLQAVPQHSPPPPQQARCLRPPASRGSWK